MRNALTTKEFHILPLLLLCRRNVKVIMSWPWVVILSVINPRGFVSFGQHHLSSTASASKKQPSFIYLNYIIFMVHKRVLA